MRLLRCESGVAYVEFALCISMLLLLFLGSVELCRYVLIIQKQEKTAATVADVVTQSNPNTSPLTDTIMQELMDAVQDMMSPYGSTSNMRIIVTDVVDEVNPSSPTVAVPTIVWQFCGGGTLTGTAYQSKLGTSVDGDASLTGAQLPGSFTMTSGEEMVMAEVYYKYQPITTYGNIMRTATVYRNAVFMPRFGSLVSYVPNSTISNASNCP